MNKLRNILIVAAVILLAAIFYYIDYSDLTWSNNRSNYLGIITALLLIIALFLSNRKEKSNS